MRNDKTPEARDGVSGEPNETRRTLSGLTSDDLLSGRFDETNGVVTGLDGESDGTIEGENLPSAFRTGPMRPAHLWDPIHRVAADLPPEDETEATDAKSRHRRLHFPR